VPAINNLVYINVLFSDFLAFAYLKSFYQWKKSYGHMVPAASLSTLSL
jgi:hypothetical protein